MPLRRACPSLRHIEESRKKLKRRVADWYFVNENGLIHENWRLMDILDIRLQMGIDVLANMAHRLSK